MSDLSDTWLRSMALLQRDSQRIQRGRRDCAGRLQPSVVLEPTKGGLGGVTQHTIDRSGIVTSRIESRLHTHDHHAQLVGVCTPRLGRIRVLERLLSRRCVLTGRNSGSRGRGRRNVGRTIRAAAARTVRGMGPMRAMRTVRAVRTMSREHVGSTGVQGCCQRGRMCPVANTQHGQFVVAGGVGLGRIGRAQCSQGSAKRRQ